MPAKMLSTTESGPLRTLTGKRLKPARIALFLYVVLIICPIRYWPLGSGVDDTWRFALNSAYSTGSAVAGEAVFTMGPLSYLMFPEHVSNNLTLGLIFQVTLWVILAIIFGDLFFRAGFALRNLALFSLCLVFASPLFWFNSAGTENLILASALTLVVVFRLRGSFPRYLAALILTGLLPVFKLSAALIGFTALAGFMGERLIHRGWKALTEVAITAAVPVAVTAGACFCAMPSARSVLNYLRGSLEMTGGYSSAMSVAGPANELILASMALLVVILWFRAVPNNGVVQFYALLLGLPIFVSFKHGFVRQDIHITSFFCFIALAMALVALAVKLDRVGAHQVLPWTALFLVIWLSTVDFRSMSNLIIYPSGEWDIRMVAGALHFGQLKQQLNFSVGEIPDVSRIEPELVRLVGDAPIASLSNDFTNIAVSGMQFRLYPVLQRYAAFTPYLDGLNAAWIRDKGPRFLVFDGGSIDSRDPWAETPAMWLEVYRWYDARFLGARNLLLERRVEPRFTRLEKIGSLRTGLDGELRFPASNQPVFWTMKCGYSVAGQIQKLLFRVPGVSMSVHQREGSVHQSEGKPRLARIIPEVLVSPVMGNYLPADLAQFYALFHTGTEPGYSTDLLQFKSSTSWSYSPACQVELLKPTN